ncbi:OTU domain-containing protein 6B, partial [Blattella germanica]
EPEKKDVEEQEVEPETRTHRVSKAQRRRDKKAVKEKEREQMIIEAEAENVHGARNVETQRIKHLLKERIDDQLKRLGESSLGTEKLRQMTSDYLREHKSDFLPFISHPDTGDLLTDEQFEDYCVEVASTPAWGGEVEVIQATGPPILIGEEYEERKRATLTFHRHMYGLGEHYNSVKPYIEEETDEM